MERIIQRQEMLIKALESLNQAIKLFDEVEPHHKYYVALRDSVIKSFEYSMDTFWKFLKQYIEVKHGRETPASPKAIFKLCQELKIITPEEQTTCSNAIDMRNLTSHTYNELLAEQFADDVPYYYPVIKKITDRCILS